MGLKCTKAVKKKLATPETQKESCNNRVYLRDKDGQSVTSLTMRGLAGTRPVMTPETIFIVENSWKIIKKDIERVGTVMFMGLLEDEGVKNTFVSFRDKTAEELRVATSLKSHVLKVMCVVDKAVNRLGEPDKLISLLHDLGQRHVEYNARPEYLDLVGPQFNNAIQPAMEHEWTPTIEQAWADFFRYMTHIMKKTMVM